MILHNKNACPNAGEPPSTEESRGAQFLMFVGPLGGTMSIGWGLFYAWFGYPWPVVACLLPIIIVGLAMPLAIRTRASPVLLATITALCLQLAVVAPLPFTGGISSFIAPWLLVVPYVAVSGGARRVWPFVMATTICAIIALAVMESFGLLPTPYVPFPIAQPLMTGLSALSVMTWGILVHQRAVQHAISQEQAVSASLKREVDKHRKTQAHLAAIQRDLIEAARNAGMAEVANGVLHNVGNGLTTVNVGVALLAERANPVPVERLNELAMLIELPDTSRTAVSLYLKRVATVACEKYSAYTTAVSQLRHQVEHVNTVVQAQQHFARHGGLVAEITVPDLLEHTLLLVASRLQAISVTKTAVPNVTLAADRHKTMLVLLNLINNAADALQGHLSPAIDIDLHADGGDLVIRVADNGSGISPANLERIFHHGFTTKPAGHGFGLHSSALAARELGGQLEVSSPGVGQGATFTFILPLAPLPVRAVKQQSSTLDM
ncbi:MAG: signal transduction histidine kinase [Myxococcota bacterium]|jgi:signal transduction histidine kinase